MKKLRVVSHLVLLQLAASSAWGLVVAPSRTEVYVVPGSSAASTLTVTNDDQVDVDVEVSKKDWFLPDEYRKWTVDTWLDVGGPAKFSLKPGESRTVQLTMRCPEEMKGEVVAMTSFMYQTKTPSMVTPVISVSVYLMAKGYEKVYGKLDDLMVRMWSDQLSVSAKVRATGNMHLRPSGTLRILSSRGKELARMEVAQGQPTYPGQEALYTGQTPKGVVFERGKYTVEADLSYQNVTLKGARKFKVTKDGKVEMGKMN